MVSVRKWGLLRFRLPPKTPNANGTLATDLEVIYASCEWVCYSNPFQSFLMQTFQDHVSRDIVLTIGADDSTTFAIPRADGPPDHRILMCLNVFDTVYHLPASPGGNFCSLI